jgi:eukaryotic-like serine/threonine-protein kinase
MSAVAHRANLGKYRLLAELGQGGMADVYLAVASGVAGSQKLVVIKLLRERMVQEEDYVEMFLDEGRLSMRLNHPNVVQTFEVGVSDGRHFIVMEYLEGLPLNGILRVMKSQGSAFDVAMHLRVISDMLSGLEYAHNAQDFDGTPLNIVHRDATPHNTFVTYDGVTKVVDFGIAKALRSSTQTTTGVIKGKISYMSPEQSRSEPIDRRSDLYAVGIMLWEAVTGARFWKGLSDMTVLQRLMTNQPAPSPREFRAELSDLVVSVCGKALAARPEDRYSTAAELQAGVEAILAEMGQQHVTSRDVGRCISEFFVDTRVKTKSLIEAQMRLKPEEITALPELRAQTLVPSTLTPSADSTRTPSGGHSASTRVDSVGGGVRAEVRVEVERPRLRLMGALFGVVLVGAALGVVFLRTSQSSDGRAGAADGGAADSAGGAAHAAPAVPEQVAVRIAATPPEAKLFLDDQPLKGNPYEGKLPRDAGAHVLRVEAPGFQTKVQAVSLAADVAADVELGRTPKSAEVRDVPRTGGGRPTGRVGAVRVPPPPTVEAPPAPAPPPAQTSSIVLPKQPGVRPVVIDTTDPWKKKEKAQ